MTNITFGNYNNRNLRKVYITFGNYNSYMLPSPSQIYKVNK